MWQLARYGEDYTGAHPAVPRLPPARGLLGEPGQASPPPPVLGPAAPHHPPLDVIALLLCPRGLLFLPSLGLLVLIKAGQTTTSQEVLDEVPELWLLLVLGDDLLLHLWLMTILHSSHHPHLMAHARRLQYSKGLKVCDYEKIIFDSSGSI